MQIKIISLARSTERRNYVENIMKKNHLEFSFYDAAEGIDTRFEKKISKKIVTSAFKSKGEVGCALSHLALYQELIQSDETMLFIMEDDFELSLDFDIVWKNLKEIDAPNSLIMLGYGCSTTLDYKSSRWVSLFSKKIRKNFINLWYPREPLMGTFAYIIGRDAAQKIFYFVSEINMPSDILLNHAPLLGIDYYAVSNQIVYPNFKDFDSLIRPVHYQKSINDRFYIIKKTIIFLAKDFFISIFGPRNKKKHGYIEFVNNK